MPFRSLAISFACAGHFMSVFQVFCSRTIIQTNVPYPSLLIDCCTRRVPIVDKAFLLLTRRVYCCSIFLLIWVIRVDRISNLDHTCCDVIVTTVSFVSLIVLLNLSLISHLRLGLYQAILYYSNLVWSAFFVWFTKGGGPTRVY